MKSVVSLNSIIGVKMCSIFCCKLDQHEFSFNMDYSCHPINFNTRTPKGRSLNAFVITNWKNARPRS